MCAFVRERFLQERFCSKENCCRLYEPSITILIKRTNATTPCLTKIPKLQALVYDILPSRKVPESDARSVKNTKSSLTSRWCTRVSPSVSRGTDQWTSLGSGSAAPALTVTHSHRARKSASDSLNDSSLVSQAGYYSQGQARGWIRIFLCIQYFHVTARYWRRLCCTVKTYWQVFRKGKREMTWHGWCDTIYVVSACNAWRRSAPIVSVSSPSLSVCLSPPLSVCLSRCEHAPFCVKILMYQI